MADSTDSAPPPNVPSRHGSLRPSNSSSHGLLVQQDSITGKSGASKKKEPKKSEFGMCDKNYLTTL